MTVVLAYSNSYMSIIMADDRINYGRNQEYGYVDGETKLIELPNMGWASGAGLANYLDTLKRSLANLEANNVGDILDVFQEVMIDCKSNHLDFADIIDESVAVASWIGSDYENIFFRVGVLSAKHFGESVMSLNNGNIFIAYPGDYLEDHTKVEVIESKYNLEIGNEIDIYTVLDNMFQIFEHIVNDSKYVSTNCDVGIQLLQQDGIYKFKLSGEIMNLIKKVKNNELIEDFEVIRIAKFPS